LSDGSRGHDAALQDGVKGIGLGRLENMGRTHGYPWWSDDASIWGRPIRRVWVWATRRNIPRVRVYTRRIYSGDTLAEILLV